MNTLKIFALLLMAAAYIAAGINHFLNPEFYIRIMPPYWGWPAFWVALSGVAEIVLGLLLLPRATRPYAAWGIIAMLTLFLTVHLHMLVHADQFANVPYWALLARLPLQGLLMLWAAWYTRTESGTTP
jgi:uncharacterized membrane protein